MKILVDEPLTMVVKTKKLGLITIEAVYDDVPGSEFRYMWHWLINGAECGFFIHRNEDKHQYSVRRLLKECAEELKQPDHGFGNTWGINGNDKLVFGRTHSKILIKYMVSELFPELAI